MPAWRDTDNYVSATVLVAPTTADVRDLPGSARATDFPVVLRLGDTTKFDSAPKIFVWDSESELADDGSAVIKPTNEDGAGRWRSPA